MNNYIDLEEKELIESLHASGWTANPNNELIKEYEIYAKNSSEFNNKIDVSITERDIQKIKAKAVQEGIPYQALISMLIHKYNEGKIAFL